MSASGEVSRRCVNPVPGAVVVVKTILAPNSRSVGFVVATAALVLVLLLPVPLENTSTGLLGSAPLYSTIRTSGNDAAGEKVTVTLLAPAAAPAMFVAT